MSSDKKQDMLSKTVGNERIQVGVLRALADDEHLSHDEVDDDDEGEVGESEESDKSDTNNSG